MAFVQLSLLFFGAGVLSILYQQAVPDPDTLRAKFPNRVTVSGLLLWAAFIAATWAIITHTTGFTRIASMTTMLFFMLLFETVFLIAVRFIRNTVVASIISLIVTCIPFAIQLTWPSFFMINLVIILATMGATTIVIKLSYVNTKALLILAVVFTITDVLNVRFIVPHLNLVPVSEPMRLLIFPTVTVGKHVVGSGDFMFLILTTLGLLKAFDRRIALIHVALQSIALLVTGLIIANKDVLLPFLTVMTPVFLASYGYGWMRKRASARRALPVQ